VGIVDGDVIVRFWIATHAEYDRLLRTLWAIAPNNDIQATAAGHPRLMPNVRRTDGGRRVV
jgi:hypothetical protein